VHGLNNIKFPMASHVHGLSHGNFPMASHVHGLSHGNFPMASHVDGLSDTFMRACVAPALTEPLTPTRLTDCCLGGIKGIGDAVLLLSDLHLAGSPHLEDCHAAAELGKALLCEE
jgi:hypothetical protein